VDGEENASMAANHRGIPIDHEDEDGKIAEAIDLMLASDWEIHHSVQVRKLALMIFDQLTGLHHMSRSKRPLLEAAALVHDTGFQISDKGHHKLSFEIVRAELTKAWSPEEALLVALVARYHRKAVPKESHPGYGELSGPDRATVNRLSGILRIADGLDRTHSNAIEGIEIRREGDRLVFRLFGQVSPTDEWGAGRKSGLFEETFQCKAVFRGDVSMQGRLRMGRERTEVSSPLGVSLCGCKLPGRGMTGRLSRLDRRSRWAL